VFDRQSGQYRDGDALFLTCTAWREMAEHAAESLVKGARVVVVGRLRQSQWETETGEKRTSYGLEVDELGPSLRFATAKVQKMTRSRAGDGFVPAEVPDDGWASATPTRPSPPIPPAEAGTPVLSGPPAEPVARAA
jgi:single-strand DNA-binding protein